MEAADKDFLKVALESMRKQSEAHKKQLAELMKQKRETQSLGREAKRVWEQTRTPLERYNKRLEDLGTLLKRGKIDQDTYDRAVAQTTLTLQKVPAANEKAFGAQALSQLGAMATGFLSLQTAIRAANFQLEEMNRIRDEAAALQRGAAEGFGPLAQLAGGDSEQLQQLVDAAKKTFAEGGARTLSEAADQIFQLQSASALNEREFFSKMTQAGVDRANDIARAAGVLTQNLGAKETGDFAAIFSKGIAAAAPATGVSPSEVLLGASQAAQVAKELKLSDEELLAATSVVAQRTGSASEAGTIVNALLRSLVKRGFADQNIEGGLGGIIAQIEGKQLTAAEQIEFFGRQEAQRGFGVLSGAGRAEFGGRVGELTQAEQTQQASRTIAAALSNPDIGATLEQRRAQNQQQLVDLNLLGTQRNLIQARQSRAAAALQETGLGGLRPALTAANRAEGAIIPDQVRSRGLQVGGGIVGLLSALFRGQEEETKKQTEVLRNIEKNQQQRAQLRRNQPAL